MGSARRGTVLIVVSGLAAILAGMALAFLARMRQDGEDSLVFTSEVQARLMLAAGLQYVAETGRIGWVEEAYGWRDVRHGLPGPRDQFGRPLYVGDPVTGVGAAFPAVGGVARCPMFRLVRPPCAVVPALAPNPIALDETLSWAELIDQRQPDPIPAAASYPEFVAGDPRPVASATPPAWFRVLREDVDTFLITCGAGATLGFADYDDALANGGAGVFASRADFDDLRGRERLLWFRVRWSPAVAGNVHMHYEDEGTFHLNPISTHLQRWLDDLPHSRQLLGSFAFIQRVLEPPSRW